jgi:Gpi18-like mannosyltransferase
MTINEKKSVFLLIITFFLIRLIFSFWPWFDSSLSGTDLSTYRQWSVQLINNPLATFYDKAQFYPYPPVANYFFLLLGFISNHFHLPINGLIMNLLFKLPNIVGEITTSYLLFSIASQHLSFRRSYLIMIFYLIQPAIIFITSVWGQWDGVMTMFIFSSLYLFFRKKIIFGFICIALAILTKPQAMPFVIPLFALGFRCGGAKRFMCGILIFCLTILVLFYPFFPGNPLFGPYLYFKLNLASFSPRFTSSGFNFWYLLYGGWQDIFPQVFGFSVRLWTRVLTVIFIIFSAGFVLLKNNIPNQILAIGISGYAFFLFFTQIKERYMYAVIPFLLLGLLMKKTNKGIIITIAVSLIFAFNTIGFYIGWMNFGLWNSTFFSYYNLDKIMAIIYVVVYIYLLSCLFGSSNITQKMTWLKKK